jgi:pimeloyl-ACP methyl ester carboxylesterase
VPGAHTAGYYFYNFHKVFREETRSILFDRPGTGWSDTSPFPRTTSKEIDELHRLLAASGEKGPYILIGHSYGGLLAGSYASRYPEQTAGLILLEAGPVETWENNEESLKYMNLFRKQILIGAWAMTFGLFFDMQKGNPEVKRIMDIYERELKDVWPELMAKGRMAKNGHTSASIFNEVNTKEFYESCRLKPGALNGKPVYGFYYLGGEDLSSQEARDFIKEITQLDEEGIDKQIEGLRRTRRIHGSLSDQYESFSLPEGTGHNFPYERPDFVIEHVRRMLGMTSKLE